MKKSDPIDFTLETTTVWDFPKRGSWATHQSNYRGNFAPQIPRNLILRYSREGETVLDPMVGSGTTLIEARLLGRNAIGLDVNEDALRITRERLDFDTQLESSQQVIEKDVRNLEDFDSDSIDLIIAHPPYFNIIEYSNGENPNDLSSIKTIPEFLEQLELGIREMFRVLKPNRYCAVLIGDTRKSQHYIPLSTMVLERFLRANFVVKEQVIKTQHNTKYAARWTRRAKDYSFYLIMHEHLFVFRKPRAGENLKNLRYSSWQGVFG